NDQPRIVKIQFGPFPGGDGSWGIDNLEFGSLPDAPALSSVQPYRIQTFAGGPEVLPGIPATSIPLERTLGVAVDAAANIFMLLANSTVMRLDSAGSLTR